MRMVLSVPLVVDKRLVLMPGTPNEVDTAYADECIDYYTCWGRTSSKKPQPKRKGRSRKRRCTPTDEYTSAIESYFRTVTSGYGGSEIIVHIEDRVPTPELRVLKVKQVLLVFLYAQLWGRNISRWLDW